MFLGLASPLLALFLATRGGGTAFLSQFAPFDAAEHPYIIQVDARSDIRVFIDYYDEPETGSKQKLPYCVWKLFRDGNASETLLKIYSYRPLFGIGGAIPGKIHILSTIIQGNDLLTVFQHGDDRGNQWPISAACVRNIFAANRLEQPLQTDIVMTDEPLLAAGIFENSHNQLWLIGKKVDGDITVYGKRLRTLHRLGEAYQCNVWEATQWWIPTEGMKRNVANNLQK